MPHDAQHETYYAANQVNWDERTGIHEVSKAYNRAGFLRGEKPLTPVELAPAGFAVVKPAAKLTNGHITLPSYDPVRERTT